MRLQPAISGIALSMETKCANLALLYQVIRANLVPYIYITYAYDTIPMAIITSKVVLPKRNSWDQASHKPLWQT
jgi:hypothetical protein